jgi:hypothetical protein
MSFLQMLILTSSYKELMDEWVPYWFIYIISSPSIQAFIGTQ